MHGMLVRKGNALESTIVRIGIWDSREHRFLKDGEIPHGMGLKSGPLFMRFAEALVLWAAEVRKDYPEVQVLRFDAVNIKNSELVPLLTAIGFQPWPTDEHNFRFEIAFSQLLGESPGS
jgi:hypothetical protein